MIPTSNGNGASSYSPCPAAGVPSGSPPTPRGTPDVVTGLKALESVPAIPTRNGNGAASGYSPSAVLGVPSRSPPIPKGTLPALMDPRHHSQSMGPTKDEVRTMTTLLSCVPDVARKSTLGISQMILYQSPHDLPLLLCLLQIAHLTVHFFRFDEHVGRYWISAYQVQRPSAPTILWHPLSSQSLRRAVCRGKCLRFQKLHFAVKKRVKMSRLRSRSPTMSRIEVLSWLLEELQLPQQE